MPCLDPQRALFCLSTENPVRANALILIQTKGFFIFVLVAIFLNSITLAVNQPQYTNPPWLDQALYYSELVFIGVFGLEMCIKIVAYGLLLHPRSYLREPWNVFDALIVIISIISVFTELGNISAMRLFRLLRPLRTISHIKQLKALISALFLAVPEAMVNFFFLMVFMFLFALLGVHLWEGKLNHRCFIDTAAMDPQALIDFLAYHEIDNTTFIPGNQSLPARFWNGTLPRLVLDPGLTSRCGGYGTCPPGPYSCMVDKRQFNADPLTFDTLTGALIVVLKSTTIDAWNDEMTDTINAVGLQAIPYFVAVTMLGGYFLVNIFLAILMNEYNVASQAMQKKRGHHHHKKKKDDDEKKGKENPAEGEGNVLLDQFMVSDDPHAQDIQRHDGADAVTEVQAFDNGSEDGEGGNTDTTTTTGKNVHSSVSFETADKSSPTATPGASPRNHRRTGSNVSSHSSVAAQNNFVGAVAKLNTSSNQADDDDDDLDLIDADDGKTATAPGSPTAGNPRNTRSTASPSPQGSPTGSPRGLRRFPIPSHAPPAPPKVEVSSVREYDREKLRTIEDDVVEEGVSFMKPRTKEIAMMFLSDKRNSTPSGGVSGGMNSFTATAFGANLDWKLAQSRAQFDEEEVSSSSSEDDLNGQTKSYLKQIGHAFDDESEENSDRSSEVSNLSSTSSDGDDDDDDEDDDDDGISPMQKIKPSIAASIVMGADASKKYRAHRLRKRVKNAESIVDTLKRSDTDDLIDDRDVEDLVAVDVGAKEEEGKKEKTTFQKIVSGFIVFMVLVTVLNVVVVAIDYYGIDPETEIILDWISYGCTVFFALELILKVFAFGFFTTFKDGFNLFDLVLVIVSVFEFFFSFQGTNAISALRALRLLRAFRAFRLASRITGVYILLSAIAPSIVPACFVCLLLILVIYIYSIVGMQFFGLSNFGGTRIFYGTIYDAALSNFIVVAGDDWSAIMMEGMKLNTAALPFFLSLFALGNYIILNLFAAVVIDNLDSTTKREWELLRQKQFDSLTNQEFPPRLILPPVPTASASVVKYVEEQQKAIAVSQEVLRDSIPFTGLLLDFAFKFKAKLIKRRTILQGHSLCIFGPANLLRKAAAIAILSLPMRILSILITLVNLVYIALESGFNEQLEPYRFVINVTFASIYTVEIFIAILAQGMAAPFDRRPELIDGSHIGGFTERDDVIVFSFFSSPANIIDTLVTLMTILEAIFPIELHWLRAFRVLRLVLRIPSLRVTSIALVRAVPQMLQAFILCLIMWFIFGIFGVQLFKGKFYDCNDEAIDYEVNCTGAFTTNISRIVDTGNNTAGWFTFQTQRVRQWTPFLLNFDHVGYASLSLLSVAVGDDWYKTMFNGIDATEAGRGMQENYSPFASLYFIAFFIMGNFFTLNLLMGVLINYFVRYKRSVNGTMVLTKEQRMFELTTRVVDASMFSYDPPKPENPVRAFFFTLFTARMSSDQLPVGPIGVETTRASDQDAPPTLTQEETVALQGDLSMEMSMQVDESGKPKKKVRRSKKLAHISRHIVREAEPIYEYVALFVNVCNVVALSMTGLTDPTIENILVWVHYVFVGWYGLEMLLQLFGLGPYGYFKTVWNRIDFVTTVAAVTFLFTPFERRLSYVARIGRFLRVIKLVGRFERAQKMFAMLIHGLPALVNLVLLFVVVFFMFGIIGIDLFSKVKVNGALDDLNNFRHLHSAILVLYQVMSTERWLDFTRACMIKAPDCTEAEGNCGTPWALAYFITFIFSSFFVLLQLCVALIVEHFEELDECEEKQIIATMGRVSELWQSTIGHRSHKATVDEIAGLLLHLPPSITGLKQVNPKTLFKLIVQLHLPIDENSSVSYEDFAHSLVRLSYGIHLRTLPTASYLQLRSQLPDRYCFTAGHIVACRFIIARWRSHMLLRETEGTAE